ncbi:diguanylate cyclase [Ramlibacter sp. PS4R-6]|uniref:diguanylate cyclase n=1 Tax=Ramlibacter sp. PS4R-6 TaxID=3133438 RepID=UPI0030A28EA3
MPDAPLFLLMYVVYPLWVLAGLADWACHRATGIATTSGIKESLMHWLMYAEIGVGMVAVAFFETNAGVLAIVLAVFLVHEATVYWDLDYTTVLRDVGPFEQMVHSFLELLPLVSLGLLAVIAWPHGPELSLRPRAEPLPPDYLLVAAAASVLFNALPLLQETWSCLRSRTRASPAPR